MQYSHVEFILKVLLNTNQPTRTLPDAKCHNAVRAGNNRKKDEINLKL